MSLPSLSTVQSIPREMMHRAASTATYTIPQDSKYSKARINERKSADGTVAPVSEPKKTKDGLYVRPAGRTRKGMEWDAVNGVWVPQQTWKYTRKDKKLLCNELQNSMNLLCHYRRFKSNKIRIIVASSDVLCLRTIIIKSMWFYLVHYFYFRNWKYWESLLKILMQVK